MLDPGFYATLCRTVAAAGGSNADLADLADAWRRAHARGEVRASVIRREAREAADRLDHPEVEPTGRAGR